MTDALSAYNVYHWSQLSSVGIVPRLKAGRASYHGSTPERRKNFVPSIFCRPSCCARIVGNLPGKKSDGCEANHSPASSAEVKNKWRSTSTFQYAIRYSFIRDAVLLYRLWGLRVYWSSEFPNTLTLNSGILLGFDDV
jgi:hypothetical protein